MIPAAAPGIPPPPPAANIFQHPLLLANN